MKLTTIVLFILILILIVFLVASFYGDNKSKESYVNFYGDKSINFSPVTIPGYKNPLIKLYDNNFYDKINGNILRVFGDELSNTKTDKTGDSNIKSIQIINRFGSGKSVISNNLSDIGKVAIKSSLEPSYKQ